MYPRLKVLRESLGLTQEEFGKSIGVAKTTYNNYETGAREPKSDFWIAVASKYRVTIDYLMGYSDDPHRTGGVDARKTDLPSPVLPSDESALLSIYRELNADGKRALIQQAELYSQVDSFRKDTSSATA